MYELSFDEVNKNVGTGDTPKLYVKVTVPERLGEESESSDKETVDTSTDGYNSEDPRETFIKSYDDINK